MKWEINYSRDAENFLKKEDIRDDVRTDLIRFLRRMKGEKSNVDVKKLKGAWDGYYRLRKGEIRIIFDLDYERRTLFVEKIDFRSKIYR